MPQPGHTLDPDEQAVDTTPPGVPVLAEAQIFRQPSLPACNDSGTCDGTGLITLGITAPTDDRTPGTSMGYLIELVGDDTPLVFPPTEPVGTDEEGNVVFHFSDRDQGLDFTLSVRAMDLAGNLGAPATVRISHRGDVGCIDGSGGCSAGTRANLGAAALVLVALGLVVRRRRAI